MILSTESWTVVKLGATPVSFNAPFLSFLISSSLHYSTSSAKMKPGGYEGIDASLPVDNIEENFFLHYVVENVFY